MKDSDTGSKSSTPAKGANKRGWARVVAKVERQFAESKSRKEEESPADRAARRTADATVWIQRLTWVLAAVAGLTLLELVRGGADTKALVDASQKQADAAQKQACAAQHNADAAQQFADTAVLINGEIGDAVKKLDAQARATQTSAQAAKSAAESADKEARLSEAAADARLGADRPILEIIDIAGINGVAIYAVGTPPDMRTAKTQFQFRVKNSGGSPAINIRYQVSQPHYFRWDTARHAEQIEAAVQGGGQQLGRNPITGSIPDVLDHDESHDPSPVVTGVVFDIAHAFRTQDDAEYLYGQLDWEDFIGLGHKWRRIFCEIVTVNPGKIIPTDCGIKEEGVSRVDQNEPKHPN